MPLFLRRFLAALIVTVLASTGAFAQISENEESGGDTASALDDQPVASSNGVNDPWEGFNRKMYAFNEGLDSYFIAPAARGYRAVTFKKQRKGISNFLRNLATPVTLVNDLLQGEFRRATKTTTRFILNSTIGFGGMADPAGRIGLERHSEDFGQTLAVWGVPSGPYLYLPVFGPSTVRDGFGRAADTLADPVFWLNTDAARLTQYTRTGMTAVSFREPLLEPLEDLKANSLDPYASFRSLYLQSREREIANGRTDFNALPDIGGFDELDDLDDFDDFDDFDDEDYDEDYDVDDSSSVPASN